MIAAKPAPRRARGASGSRRHLVEQLLQVRVQRLLELRELGRRGRRGGDPSHTTAATVTAAMRRRRRRRWPTAAAPGPGAWRTCAARSTAADSTAGRRRAGRLHQQAGASAVAAVGRRVPLDRHSRSTAVAPSSASPVASPKSPVTSGAPSSTSSCAAAGGDLERCRAVRRIERRHCAQQRPPPVAECARHHRLHRQPGRDRLVRRLLRKGAPAGQRLDEDEPEGVDVRGGRRLCTAHLLRGDVRRGAHCHARAWSRARCRRGTRCRSPRGSRGRCVRGSAAGGAGCSRASRPGARCRHDAPRAAPPRGRRRGRRRPEERSVPARAGTPAFRRRRTP